MIAGGLTRDESGVAAVEFALTSPVYFPALACPTESQTQTYAASNVAGLFVPSSAFSMTTDASCSGALVSAAYDVPTFTSGLGLPNITVQVSACYPS